MMKNKISILFILFINSIVTFGQVPDWTWAKSTGGIEMDAANSVAVDASGNSYVVGYFRSSAISFGLDTMTNAGTGYSDVFIAKYNSIGNLLWAKSAGGSSYDEATSISLDKFGFVYVTGYFESLTITFDTITLIKNGSGCSDIFIVKYDPSGNIVWAKNAGGTSLDNPYSITIDTSQNIYITGYFQSSTINFGSTTLTNFGENDIFLAKYDSDGNVLWAKSAGGSRVDQANSVSVDSSGNSYITGFFQSPLLNFDTSVTLYNNSNTYEIYIAKYNPGGNLLWAKNIEGNYYDVGNSVTTDHYGHVYIAGYFQSDTIVFDADTLTNLNNNRKLFVAKYDPDGNELWVKSAGGSSWNYVNSITSDALGDLYITGGFVDSDISFDTISLSNIGVTDIFIAKFDSNGNVLWAKSVGNTNNEDAYSITVDASMNAYITGYFFSSYLTFGSTTLSNNGSEVDSHDIFLAKLSNSAGINELSNSIDISIFPNPTYSTFTLTVPPATSQVQIINSVGQIIISTNIDKQSNLNFTLHIGGLYFIQITTDKQTVTKKLIVTN